MHSLTFTTLLDFFFLNAASQMILNLPVYSDLRLALLLLMLEWLSEFQICPY